jgi:hypothetical protein
VDNLQSTALWTATTADDSIRIVLAGACRVLLGAPGAAEDAVAPRSLCRRSEDSLHLQDVVWSLTDLSPYMDLWSATSLEGSFIWYELLYC